MRLFGHLFCEYLTYNRKNRSLEEIEDNLKRLGYDVGTRMWELFLLRERAQQNERTATTKNELTTAKQVLEKIKNSFWKFAFGQPASSLERIRATDLQFYLIDRDPLTDFYISYPRDYRGYVPSVFTGGMVQAALDACDIDATVQVHLISQDGQLSTYYHIKCAEGQK